MCVWMCVNIYIYIYMCVCVCVCVCVLNKHKEISKQMISETSTVKQTKMSAKFSLTSSGASDKPNSFKKTATRS